MATKDFSKMTTNRLKALLQTASDEDKTVINEILEQRAQVSSAKPNPSTNGLGGNPEGQEYNNPEPLSETEQAVADAQAASESANEKPKKMTEEELHALATELKEKNMRHRCQVVPFNTVEWVDGYICGVIEEKRSMKVLYAIKTDDGRKLVKVHDSALLRISDEVVEKATVNRTRSTKKEKAEEWTDEDITKGMESLIPNIGKEVTVGELSGRIVGIVPEKRAQTFMYRIEVKTDEDTTKLIHRVHTNEELKIAESLDEEGQKLNDAYMARHEKLAQRVKLTPEERIENLKKDVAKAEDQIKIWTDRLAARKKMLEEALAEYTNKSEEAEESLE